MTEGEGVRIETDTMGEMEVPAGALYGAQTARAVANFPVSGWRLPASFIAALARIKAAFARAHGELRILDAAVAGAIAAAADEVAGGAHAGQFPVDVFQTGSGTSSNMNVNEVVAHLANRQLGGDPAAHRPVHPNDHVNRGQSSNDVVPAALRLAALEAWRGLVRPRLDELGAALGELADRHRKTVTLGRTHLMDAVPTTYGRVFAGWAARVAAAAERAEVAASGLRRLPLGGTAVGTGVNANPRAVALALGELSAVYQVELAAMAVPEAGIAAQDEPIALADAYAGVARVLLAVANDVRARASGPFGGLGELRLPPVQPGSSIMPGKVNPVIPEAVAQAAIQVEGLAGACRASASLHQFELSHANPMLAWNLDAAGRLLDGAASILAERCLRGLRVEAAACRANAEASPALAAALAVEIGYERAAELAREAEGGAETVAAVARRRRVLPEARLAQVLDLDRLAAGSGGYAPER